MAEIEDQGYEEFYAPFVKITGKRGTVLLFYDGEDEGNPSNMGLASEIGSLLDSSGPEVRDG